MSISHVKTGKKVRIFRDTESGDFMVMLYIDGRYVPSVDYSSPSKEDAIKTAQHILINADKLT